MSDFFFGVITHPAFGLATAAIGFLAGHFLSIGRDRRNEFNAAAAIFRTSFNVAKRRIEAGESSATVINDEFLRHDEAMRNFAHQHKGRTLRRFQQYWAEYKQYHDDMCNRSDESVFWPPEGESQLTRKRQIVATIYIDKLLKYAEHR